MVPWLSGLKFGREMSTHPGRSMPIFAVGLGFAASLGFAAGSGFAAGLDFTRGLEFAASKKVLAGFSLQVF